MLLRRPSVLSPMPILKARRQLHGDYGSVAAGEHFEVSDELAAQLEAAGLVEIRVLHEAGMNHGYETKVIHPEAPTVGPRPPFCNLHVPDAEPEAVAPESNRVLPETDIPASGTADSGRRRERKGPGAGR